MSILIGIGLALLTLVAAIITWFGISGPLILAGVTLLWGIFSHFQTISGGQVLTVVLIALGLEAVEIFLSGWAAGQYGATRKSMWFAILGGFLGTIAGASLFLFFGALLGLLAGSYLGAYLGELSAGKSEQAASRAALGALIGNIAGKSIKMAAAVVMGGWLIQQVL